VSVKDCGLALRLHDHWTRIEGVASGLEVAADRPVDEWVSVGGVRHEVRGRRAPRTWRVNLGHAGPDAVAALMVAAQGDGGDVWLWDEAAARANVLDPVLVRGRDDYPVVVCDGVPLRAVTGGGTMTVDVPLLANVTVEEYPTMVARIGIDTVPGVAEALVKVAVPATPDGYTLTNAELVLHRSASSSGTVTAYTASNSWAEPPTTSPTPATYWDTVPAGPSRGYATVADTTTIPISGVAGYVGGVMSLRLVKTSGALGAYFYPRTHATKPPKLRLTYTRIPQDVTFTQHLPAGAYWFTCWTDAAPSTSLGTVTVPGVPIPVGLTVPSGGSGFQRVTIDLSTLTSSVDRDYTFTITDTTAYTVAGLMLSALPPTGYLPGHKTPVRVSVRDPQAVLEHLWTGDQGRGPRSVELREVGA